MKKVTRYINIIIAFILGSIMIIGEIAAIILGWKAIIELL
jgi:hypothetical protein